MAERDQVHEPAEPAAPTRVGVGARASRASSAREKLRTRERQAAFVAGDIALRIEAQAPGRIYAIKVTCTRFKTTSTIVFDGRRSLGVTNERDGDDASDCSDDDDDGAAPAVPAVQKPQKTHKTVNITGAAARSERAPAVGGREQVTKGAAGAGSAGWQQPRKAVRPPQPPQQPVKPKQPVDRNAISARGSQLRGQVEQQQVSSMLASVREISREVCPTSTFTFEKEVTIGGRQVRVPLVPNSPAAQMAREAPASLGAMLMDLYLARNGAAVRALLTPAEPESHPISTPSAVGFGAPAVPPLLAAERSAMAVEGERWNPFLG